VVGADEGVPEERVGAWGGREDERGEPGAPRGGVGGDELGGEVGARGEARGDGERVDAEELGLRRGRGRREEAGEDGQGGRGLRRRHLIAPSKRSLRSGELDYTRSTSQCRALHQNSETNRTGTSIQSKIAVNAESDPSSKI
jgi:hypothetical protein